MSKFTLQTQNHWRYVGDGGAVSLIQIGGAASRWYVNVFVTLLGFGVGLTWWRMTIPIPDDTTAADFVSGFPEGGGEPIADGQAFQFYEDSWPHNVPRESLGRTREDGEVIGREKAP